MVAESTDSSSQDLGPSRSSSAFSAPAGKDSEVVSSSTPSSQIADSRFKVRIRFRKDYDLRLLSHHDLMRTFERMLRRADLPVRHTQGFHPKPRLIFALSLPLGVIGCEEVAELELDVRLSLEEIETRLLRQAPPGLRILSIREISPRVTAQVRRLTYRLPLPEDLSQAFSPGAPEGNPEPSPEGNPEPSIEVIRQAAAEVLQASQCWVDRKRPPKRRVDLRPFLSDLQVIPAASHGGPTDPSHAERAQGGATSLSAEEERPSPGSSPLWFLEMELWLTPTGTARPEEVLELLKLKGIVETGAIFERSRLELHDELTSSDAKGFA